MSQHQLMSVACGILGIVWAHSFLDTPGADLAPVFRSVLNGIGDEADRQEAVAPAKLQIKRDGLETLSVLGFTREPQLLAAFRGIVVLHKPPDWEVDGKYRARMHAEHDTEDSRLIFSSLPAFLLCSSLFFSFSSVCFFGRAVHYRFDTHTPTFS